MDPRIAPIKDALEAIQEENYVRASANKYLTHEQKVAFRVWYTGKDGQGDKAHIDALFTQFSATLPYIYVLQELIASGASFVEPEVETVSGQPNPWEQGSPVEIGLVMAVVRKSYELGVPLRPRTIDFDDAAGYLLRGYWAGRRDVAPGVRDLSGLLAAVDRLNAEAKALVG